MQKFAEQHEESREQMAAYTVANEGKEARGEED